MKYLGYKRYTALWDEKCHYLHSITWTRTSIDKSLTKVPRWEAASGVTQTRVTSQPWAPGKSSCLSYAASQCLRGFLEGGVARHKWRSFTPRARQRRLHLHPPLTVWQWREGWMAAALKKGRVPQGSTGRGPQRSKVRESSIGAGPFKVRCTRHQLDRRFGVGARGSRGAANVCGEDWGGHSV